jgi:hypothetical protein
MNYSKLYAIPAIAVAALLFFISTPGAAKGLNKTGSHTALNDRGLGARYLMPHPE